MTYPPPGQPDDPERHQTPDREPPGEPDTPPEPDEPPPPAGPAPESAAPGTMPSAGMPPPVGAPPPGAPPPPGGQQGYAYAPRPPGYNVMAILALVFAFVFAPVGIVLGHVAKRQIRQSGEQGDTMATVGLVLSYVFTGLVVLACCVGAIAAISAGMQGSS